MPPQIDFVIIGAQKSGTTSLYRILRQHPEIHLPETKEIHFFAREELYSRGAEYLTPHYRDAGPDMRKGLAYVHNMYFPATASRIHRHNPDADILAVLRDPVDRAYSAYWFARRNGWEDRDTFEDALRVENDRRRDGSFKERAELTYLEHGHYAEQLRPFVDLFGRERLHVILTRDLREDPDDVVETLLRGMGLSPPPASVETDLEANVSGTPRIPALQRLLLSHPIRSALQKVVPRPVRRTLRLRLMNPLLEANIRPERYPPMADATRQRLEEYFSDRNDDLRELLDRPLPGWS